MALFDSVARQQGVGGACDEPVKSWVGGASGTRAAGRERRRSSTGFEVNSSCAFNLFKLPPFGPLSPPARVGFSPWLGVGLEEDMSSLNWKPFVFGGLASVTAECGEWWAQTPAEATLRSSYGLVKNKKTKQTLPPLFCSRDVPHRLSQDPASSPRPGGRQQVPRDPVQRHAPCYDEDRKGGGAPGSLFRVSLPKS